MTVLTSYVSLVYRSVLKPYENYPSLCFSGILILVAFIVSFRKLELWNHQGSILRCYLASWIGFYSFTALRNLLIVHDHSPDGYRTAFMGNYSS